MCEVFLQNLPAKSGSSVKYFDNIQEKQNLIAKKVQVIEENLSKSVADLSSRLEQLDKQLIIKDQSSPIQLTTSHGKGTPTSTDTPHNATTNQLSIDKPAVVSGNSSDRIFNVVIYGIKENPSGTPRSARTKSDIDSACTY